MHEHASYIVTYLVRCTNFPTFLQCKYEDKYVNLFTNISTAIITNLVY